MVGTEQIAQLVGVIIGAIILLVTCWVFAKQKSLGLPGIGFAFFGVVLLGMSVWSTAQITVGPEGLNARFEQIEQRLQNLDETVEDGTARIKSLTEFSLATREVVNSNVQILQDQSNLLHQRYRIPSREFRKLEIKPTPNSP